MCEAALGQRFVQLRQLVGRSFGVDGTVLGACGNFDAVEAGSGDGVGQFVEAQRLQKFREGTVLIAPLGACVGEHSRRAGKGRCHCSRGERELSAADLGYVAMHID